MAFFTQKLNENSRWVRFLTWLWNVVFGPHPSFTDVGQKRRARLLMIVSFSIFVVLLIGIVLSNFSDEPTMSNGVVVVLAGVSLLAYLLGRSRYFAWGAFLLILVFSGSAYALILLERVDPSVAVYGLVPLALIIGSVFLPVWIHIFIIASNVLAAALLPMLLEEVETTSFVYAAGNLLAIGVLSSVISAFRNSLERARLSELRQANADLLATQMNLENRVVERTKDLERRTTYLAASAKVGQVANTMLESAALMHEVVSLIQAHFGFYYVGLYLIDEEKEWLVLRAGSGEAGRILLSRGHRLVTGDGSTMGWCVENALPRVVEKSNTDVVRASIPELLAVRSEVILPLRSRGEVLGALTVQSDQADAFDEDTVSLLQSMADQIAVALDNVYLLSQVQSTLEAERRVYGDLSRDAWVQMLRGQNEMGYRYEDQSIYTAEQRWSEEMLEAFRTASVTQGEEGDFSTLALPLLVRGRPVGVMRVCKDKEGATWSEEETLLLNTVAEQLGVALESARLYQDTQRRAARERLVRQVTARMRESLDVEMVLSAAVQEMVQTLDLPEVTIRMAPSLQE